MQDIGRSGTAAGQDVYRMVVEIRHGSAAEARQHKRRKQQARSAGNSHHGHAQKRHGGQEHDGPASSQPEGYETGDKAGDQIAGRMGGKQHAAEGIGKPPAALQVRHGGAKHQGNQAAAEKGVKARQQQPAAGGFHTAEKRKHRQAP